tara:strand:- start:341 stop:610 length:270 start_codon:yes stop_codon:yes gene_type:complete
MEGNKGFSENFIRSLLLTLEHTDYDEFMKLSYAVIMQSPSYVLKREENIEAKVEGIDNMIKFFEEKEEYEKCTNLQKLKHLLFLDSKDK